MEATFFLPLAYDHTYEGEGTVKRCYAALKAAIRIQPSERRFVLTGGEDPGRDYPNLAFQMSQVLMRAHFNADITIAPANGWGTIHEIAKAFEEMRRLHPNGPATVYVATNFGHMPRVLIYMQALKPRGWKIRPIVAWEQSFSWKERLRDEPKKLALCPVQIALFKLGKL